VAAVGDAKRAVGGGVEGPALAGQPVLLDLAFYVARATHGLGQLRRVADAGISAIRSRRKPTIAFAITSPVTGATAVSTTPCPRSATTMVTGSARAAPRQLVHRLVGLRLIPLVQSTNGSIRAGFTGAGQSATTKLAGTPGLGKGLLSNQKRCNGPEPRRMSPVAT
jgi:hypothetical protein